MGIQQDTESPSTSMSTISEDEVALYDRQIRLWGVEAQKRLREAKILIIGLGGLGAEISKNIALAGAKSITLLDDKNVSPDDRWSQIFLRDAKSGENRAEVSQPGVKALNPNVEVVSDSGKVEEKDSSFFTRFDIVCATNCPMDVLFKINEICREHSIKFICGDVWGYFGYCFIDLNSFTYLREVQQKWNTAEFVNKKPKIEKMMEEVDFIPLAKAMACKSGKVGMGLGKKTPNVFFLLHILSKFREQKERYPLPAHREADIEELKSIRATVMPNLGFEESKVSDEDLHYVFGELGPICAVVGGIFTTEVIKAIGATSPPYKNFFFFDGHTNTGVVENIGS